ncbi:MAG: DUF5711 family protein [Oscillospiraceae bacterium]|jgi:hypothetical protein|nr:DUF5711 family protein [Oscillospiraceae bacterium]
MSGDSKSKKIKRAVIKYVVLLTVFTIIAIILFSLLTGNDAGISRFTRLFSQRVPEITVDEFSFNVGRSRMFAQMNGSVAAVGTLGLQVLDTAGRETIRDSFRMTTPTIISNESRCIVFDIGGSTVRVINGTEILKAFETEGRIVSASINRNGWFCVVTQESGGFKGTTMVYNSSGAVEYRVNLGSGFILSAELSPDNRSLAILNLTETGSKINFYHDLNTHKDEPDQEFYLPDGLIVDITYLSNNEIIAISTDLLHIIKRSGTGEAIYTFEDKRLGGYTYTDNLITLHLYDYGIGNQGRLITITQNGSILGEIEIDREIISMSSIKNSLVVLRNDGVVFYNQNLEEYYEPSNNLSVGGATQILAITEDIALAASDNSAVIIKRHDDPEQ